MPFVCGMDGNQYEHQKGVTVAMASILHGACSIMPYWRVSIFETQ